MENINDILNYQFTEVDKLQSTKEMQNYIQELESVLSASIELIKALNFEIDAINLGGQNG